MARVRRLCHIKIADWNYMILQSVTSTIMLFMQTSTSIIEVAGMGPISHAVATKALRAQQRGKCTPFHDKKSSWTAVPLWQPHQELYAVLVEAVSGGNLTPRVKS